MYQGDFILNKDGMSYKVIAGDMKAYLNDKNEVMFYIASYNRRFVMIPGVTNTVLSDVLFYEQHPNILPPFKALEEIQEAFISQKSYYQIRGIK